MTISNKKAIINDRLIFWQNRLKLNHWNIKTICHNKDHPDKDGTMAQVERNFIYQKAIIHFYLPAINTSNIDYTICHELVHILLADYDYHIISNGITFETYVAFIDTILKNETELKIKLGSYENYKIVTGLINNNFTLFQEKVTELITNIILEGVSLGS